MAIWDNNKNGSDRFDTIDSVTISADSKKCPGCGANLFFDAGHNALMCGNCGGIYDPATLDMTGSLSLANPERNYDGNIEMNEDDTKRQEIVCNACGAQIVTDNNTSATFCAFCGSPALVTRRLTREFKPDYIIPFSIDKEKAKNIFDEHCAKIPHLPKNYITKETLSRITGLYVPTWIISSDVDANLCGMAVKGKALDDVYENYNTDSGSYKQRIYAKVKFRLKDIPFDGERKLPDRLMAAAEPFDYSELVEFRPEYLQGYFAEKYDEQPLDMTDKIYNRMDKYVLDFCGKVNLGYDGFVPIAKESHTRYVNQSVKYALLPVWFLSIEHDGIRYQYIINGQTGKVSGEFPYAKGWDKIERNKTRAKLKAVDMNKTIRGFLYALPFIVFAFVFPLTYIQFANFLFEHPIEAGLIFVTSVLAYYMLVYKLPKLLFGKEQKQIENIEKTGEHDLDKPQGVETYLDTSYAMEAYETTFDFVSLESGWNYKDEKNYDFMTAKPEAEKYDDDSGTDFEMKGHDRQMLS